METEVKTFVDNVDAWIKQIRREFSTFSGVPQVIDEHEGNIQHNYELIKEMQSQMEELKQEIHALKLIHIISLKKKQAVKA